MRQHVSKRRDDQVQKYMDCTVQSMRRDERECACTVLYCTPYIDLSPAPYTPVYRIRKLEAGRI